MRPRLPLGRRGFTLIELFIVIIIIGLMTALAVPRFQRTASDFQLKNAAFSLYKTVQFARERALVERREFQIRFDFENRKWQVFSAPMQDEAKPDFHPVNGRWGKAVTLPEELTFEGKENTLTCHPDGNCDPTKIRVSGAEGSYEIAVEGLGGVIRIHETSNE